MMLIKTPEIENLLSNVWKNCDSILESNKKNKQDSKIKLKSQIESLSHGEYCYVFKIITKHNEKYTQNKNGVFIDLKSLSDPCLDEIISYVDTVNKIKVDTCVQYIVE